MNRAPSPQSSIPFIVGLIVFILVAASAGWFVSSGNPSHPTRWIMLNVSGKDAQADCHLLQFSDGSAALIDAADAWDAPGVAVASLKKHGITRLRLVMISHFHLDHYGRLVDLINAGIRVERVAINLPGDRRLADREIPWGCNWEHVQSVLSFLREKNIPYFTPKAGDTLIQMTNAAGVVTKLEVVCLFDGINTPIGETDMNDTSIIARFTHGKTRALFTGDLNHPLGAYLATGPFDIAADILKAPHHGTEGLAPNEFFDRVGAKVFLVPSPAGLWASPRSKRPRDYYSERKLPCYVNGLHGDVRVLFDGEGFRIETERDANL